VGILLLGFIFISSIKPKNIGDREKLERKDKSDFLLPKYKIYRRDFRIINQSQERENKIEGIVFFKKKLHRRYQDIPSPDDTNNN
jgi:hypothetical protein